MGTDESVDNNSRTESLRPCTLVSPVICMAEICFESVTNNSRIESFPLHG
jgi:hypothetical protein